MKILYREYLKTIVPVNTVTINTITTTITR